MARLTEYTSYADAYRHFSSAALWELFESIEHRWDKGPLDVTSLLGNRAPEAVYRDLNAKSFAFKLAAVVSGYQSSLTEVLQPKEIKREEVTPEDHALGRIVEDEDTKKTFRLHPTGQVVKENTGILKAYDIRHAVELIRKNPVGPKSE